MTYILDASADLAVLKSEPGQERVAVLMAGSRRPVAAVNWVEAATKLADSGQAAPLIKATVITADRPWLDLATPLGLTIECIRPAP